MFVMSDPSEATYFPFLLLRSFRWWPDGHADVAFHLILPPPSRVSLSPLGDPLPKMPSGAQRSALCPPGALPLRIHPLPSSIVRGGKRQIVFEPADSSTSPVQLAGRRYRRNMAITPLLSSILLS